MCLLILDNGVGPLSTAKCHIIKILFLIKAHYYYYNNNNNKKNTKKQTQKKLAQMRLGFPGGSDGKESTCNEGDPGSIPGSGRSP